MRTRRVEADPVYAQGYCVLEDVYSPSETQDMRHLLDEHWRAAGSPSLRERGFGIHPLLQRVPAIAEYLANPTVVGTLAEALGDDVRLARTGARITDESSAASLAQWHNHFHWDSDSLMARTKIERMLALIYPEGTSDEVGNFIGLPRRVNEPMQDIDRRAERLPGEVVLRVPPGSVVIFDTAFWHSARRGSRPGRRHVLGGQYQGWSVGRSHPDDTPVDTPEIARFKAQSETLCRLVEEPHVASRGN